MKVLSKGMGMKLLKEVTKKSEQKAKSVDSLTEEIVNAINGIKGEEDNISGSIGISTFDRKLIQTFMRFGEKKFDFNRTHYCIGKAQLIKGWYTGEWYLKILGIPRYAKKNLNAISKALDNISHKIYDKYGIELLNNCEEK